MVKVYVKRKAFNVRFMAYVKRMFYVRLMYVALCTVYMDLM